MRREVRERRYLTWPELTSAFPVPGTGRAPNVNTWARRHLLNRCDDGSFLSRSAATGDEITSKAEWTQLDRITVGIQWMELLARPHKWKMPGCYTPAGARGSSTRR